MKMSPPRYFPCTFLSPSKMTSSGHKGNSSCAQAARGLESYAVMQRNPRSLPQLFSLMVLLGILGLLQTASAHNSNRPQSATHEADTATEPTEIVTRPLAVPTEQKTTSPTASSALVIGPGDDLEITVYGAPDLSGHTRVSADGNISMPLIGYLRIAGLSSSEAEGADAARWIAVAPSPACVTLGWLG